MIDLHCHTTASDGSLSPTELVAEAARLSITHLSITDHDTTAALTEAQAACESAAIRLISGIELSTQYEGRSVDILGYGIDPAYPPLQETLQELVASRRERIPHMIERLQRAGLEVELDDVKSLVSGEVIGRPHVAQALVARGIVQDVSEAFDKYIGRGKVGYVPKEVLTPPEAIELIRSAGGLPVLAHPGFIQLERASFEAMLDSFVEAGLSGLEVFYSQHSTDEVVHFKECAAKRKLVMTGGSDFHGSSKPHIKLGMGPGGSPLPTKLAYDLIDAIDTSG